MYNTAAINHKDQLVAFVNQVGECLLYPLDGYKDLYSLVGGENNEDRMNLVCTWAEQLHLEKKIFLSLACEGKPTATSWHRFIQVYPKRSMSALNLDEDGLLGVIRKMGGGSSREILQMCGMPANRFDVALTGLRCAMRIACCGQEESDDRTILYSFDITERWVPEEFVV